MISAYYIVHRRKINVDDLYTGNPSSIYWHTLGVNWRAPTAWVCGVAPSMPGFLANVNPDIVVPRACMRIFYINFLTGFVISAVVFVALHAVFPARRLRAFVDGPVSSEQVIDFYRRKWDGEAEVVGGSLYSGSDAEPIAVRPDKDDAAVMDVPHLV